MGMPTATHGLHISDMRGEQERCEYDQGASEQQERRSPQEASPVQPHCRVEEQWWTERDGRNDGKWTAQHVGEAEKRGELGT